MRVYLVESHASLREILHAALDAAPGITVTGSCGSVARAVQEIPVHAPHVAIIGDCLPDGDHLSLCWQLAQLAPRLRVVFHVTMDDDQALMAELVGASGCVLKQVRAADLIEAVRRAFGDLIEDERRLWGERIANIRGLCERSQELCRQSRELRTAARLLRGERAPSPGSPG